MTTGLPKRTTIVHVPARKVGDRIPGALAVGAAVLEFDAGPSTESAPAGRLSARWTKGASSGAARVDVRPSSKTTSEVTVTIHRPKGAQSLLWPAAAVRRLEALLAQALAYEIETRNAEETSGFGIRRTSVGLVKARAS